jgi:hypothetical protein
MNVFNEAIKVLLFIVSNINSQTFYNTYTCAYKWMADMESVTLFIHGSRLQWVLVREQHTKQRRPNRFLQLRYGIKSRRTSKYPSILPPGPEGLSQWKIPMTPSGIEFATFRLVTQCLNQPPRIPHKLSELLKYSPGSLLLWTPVLTEFLGFPVPLLHMVNLFSSPSTEFGEWGSPNHYLLYCSTAIFGSTITLCM